jgi:hypothetical protein
VRARPESAYVSGNTMSSEQLPPAGIANRIYDLYVKPLEPAHMGEYALVTENGQIALKPTLVEAAWQAAQAPHKKNVIFKVGTRSVGKLPTTVPRLSSRHDSPRHGCTTLSFWTRVSSATRFCSGSLQR